MKVHVRFFARAKDLVGAELACLDIPDGSCVGDLRRCLAEAHPALTGLLERSAIAVDNEFAEDNWVLPARAELALLPPVSGG
jgi:molybdopterin converting factor subunit 1